MVKFQFHYDLILLLCHVWFNTTSTKFQFHYDLILFFIMLLSKWLLFLISISLWSYSIYTCMPYITCFFKISISLWSYSIIVYNCFFNNRSLISISLWSYSIICTVLSDNCCYCDFNFIMILFYSELVIILIYYFNTISISLWSYSITNNTPPF